MLVFSLVMHILYLFGAAFLIVAVLPCGFLAIYDEVKLFHLERRYRKARKRAIANRNREILKRQKQDIFYKEIQEIFNESR
jgi:hypothetical protein